MKKSLKRVDYYKAAGRKAFSVALPVEIVDAFDVIAKAEDVSRQTVILWASRDYLAKYPRLVQAKALVS